MNQRVQITPVQGTPTMRSPQYRLIYGNAFGFKVSPSDFCLTIFNNMGMPAAPIQINQEEVSVMMPLPQLKILAECLANIVKGVEKELGPIRIPSKAKVSDEQINMLLNSVRNVEMVPE